MADYGLSQQDIQDLVQIRSQLPANDPRRSKIEGLLGASGALVPGVTLPGVPGMPVPKELQGPPTRPILPQIGPDSEAAARINKGQLKGLGSTAYNIGHLLQTGANKLTGADINLIPDQKPASLVPSGPDEERGYMGEQLAEFMLPGGQITKAGKFVEGMKMLQGGDKGMGLLRTLARAGTEGGLTGALNTTHGESFKEGASVGAAVPVAGQALEDYILKPLAKKGLNYAMRATVKDTGLGRRNPGQGVLDEGILASSIENLLPKVEAARARVGQQIDDVLNAPLNRGKLVDLNPTIAQVDDAIIRAGEKGAVGEVEQLRKVRQQLTDEIVFDPATGMPQIDPDTGKVVTQPRASLSVSPYDATSVKRGLQSESTFNGQPYNSPVDAVRKGAIGRLGESVEQQVPEIVPVNRRYSNIEGAQKATKRRVGQVAAGREFSPWNWMIPFGVGSGVGYSEDQDPMHAAIRGLQFAALTKGMTSVPALTGMGAAANYAQPASRFIGNLYLGLADKKK